MVLFRHKKLSNFGPAWAQELSDFKLEIVQLWGKNRWQNERNKFKKSSNVGQMYSFKQERVCSVGCFPWKGNLFLSNLRGHRKQPTTLYVSITSHKNGDDSFFSHNHILSSLLPLCACCHECLPSTIYNRFFWLWPRHRLNRYSDEQFLQIMKLS